MAPKGQKDNHATIHAHSDIGYQPNRGQWAGMSNQRGHFATETLLVRPMNCWMAVATKVAGGHLLYIKERKYF
jgi:hypothetical protein